MLVNDGVIILACPSLNIWYDDLAVRRFRAVSQRELYSKQEVSCHQ